MIGQKFDMKSQNAKQRKGAMRVVKMPGHISGVEAYQNLNLEESVRVWPHPNVRGKYGKI